MVNLLFRTSSTATKPVATSVKSAPLTNLEIDGNFRSIQDGINTILDGSTPIDSPSLTGIPTAPTAAVNTNTTQIASTAFVVAQIADDAVLLAGSYANPSWITSLSETKVLPPQTDNVNKALVTNGTSTSWQTVQPTLTNDVSTDTTQYIGMSRSATGAWTTSYVASTKLYFNPSTGALNATDFNSLSDVTRKKNVVGINNAVDTIKQVRGVEFEWVDNGKKSSGVIAQELERILPHLVETNDNGIKSVSYGGLIAYLIESIKQLSDKIEVLESKQL